MSLLPAPIHYFTWSSFYPRDELELLLPASQKTCQIVKSSALCSEIFPLGLKIDFMLTIPFLAVSAGLSMTQLSPSLPPTSFSFLLLIPFPSWNTARLLFSRLWLQHLMTTPLTPLASPWPVYCRLPIQCLTPTFIQIPSEWTMGTQNQHTWNWILLHLSLYKFPVDAVADYHKLSGLNQCKK